MIERHHSYDVLPEAPEGHRYRIFKDGQHIQTSAFLESRELAVAKGHEKACELDGIWD